MLTSLNKNLNGYVVGNVMTVNQRAQYLIFRFRSRRKANLNFFKADIYEYVGNFYGTPKKYVDRAMDDGRDVILDIEIQGANQICAKRPETVRIFIAPPSWVELERRLTARGTDSQEVIQSRLLRAKVELQTASSYDYLVINDTVEQAVTELAAILCAEHCRPAERLEQLLHK